MSESIMRNVPVFSKFIDVKYLLWVIIFHHLTNVSQAAENSTNGTSGGGGGGGGECDLSNYDKYFETGLGQSCMVKHKSETEKSCQKYICSEYHKCVCPEGLRAIRFEGTDIRLCLIEFEGKCEEYTDSFAFMKEDGCSWKSLDTQRKTTLSVFENAEGTKRSELEVKLKKIVALMKFHEYAEGKDNFDIYCASGKCNDEGTCTDGLAQHLLMFRAVEAAESTGTYNYGFFQLIFISIGVIVNFTIPLP